MSNLDILSRAAADFETRLVAVGPEQWDVPTPNTEWTVRDMVAHVVRGNEMAIALLNGATTDEARDALNTERPLTDPLAEFRSSTAAQAAAFARPDVASMTCHHPLMDVSGEQLLGFRFMDLSLHAWDLARALGLDETLDQDVVAAVWENMSPLAPFIGTLGIFGEGPSTTLSEDAPLQERLLDLTGRRP